MSAETKTIAEQFPWLTVGGNAYTLYRGSWDYVRLIPVKIEKITKSRVTLDNGSVYYVGKHRTKITEHGTDYYRSAELIAEDDPRVEQIKAAVHKKNIEHTASKAVESFMRDKGVDNARAAIAALMDYIAEAEKDEN